MYCSFSMQYLDNFTLLAEEIMFHSSNYHAQRIYNSRENTSGSPADFRVELNADFQAAREDQNW